MMDFFRKPLNWVFIFVWLVLIAMTGFVVFRPVQVIPRLAYGPDYGLIDQEGQLYTKETVAGKIVLYGFGYTNDPTGAIVQTVEDMRRFQARVQKENYEAEIVLTLIFFDHQRDTIAQRVSFAAQHGLETDNWFLLSGEADTLKRVIGQGFGVYYEQVPLSELTGEQASPDAYGYLQAQRYTLVDERNIIRAEYRAPLDLDLIMRDVRYIIREKNSTGVNRALNEAAHLFLCYPQ